MPTTDDKLFIQNEKGEVYPIELHYRMVSEAAKKVEFEFDGHMSETKLIANYTRVAPWAMRDLFPCRYKADRWIMRSKKIGKMNSHRFLHGHNRLIEKQLKAVRIWL